jgi:hypothetical protein
MRRRRALLRLLEDSASFICTINHDHGREPEEGFYDIESESGGHARCRRRSERVVAGHAPGPSADCWISVRGLVG